MLSPVFRSSDWFFFFSRSQWWPWAAIPCAWLTSKPLAQHMSSLCWSQYQVWYNSVCFCVCLLPSLPDLRRLRLSLLAPLLLLAEIRPVVFALLAVQLPVPYCISNMFAKYALFVVIEPTLCCNMNTPVSSVLNQKSKCKAQILTRREYSFIHELTPNSE